MKKFHSKYSALWAFCEDLMRGENMEEYGRGWCICSYTGILANFGLNSQVHIS